MTDLTIEQLRDALGVTRRTIERQLESKAIVATSHTASGRARFSAEYVE